MKVVRPIARPVLFRTIAKATVASSAATRPSSRSKPRTLHSSGGLWRVAEELTVRGGEEIRAACRGASGSSEMLRPLQHQWGNPHGRRSSYFVLDSAGVAAVAGLVSHRAGVGPSGAVIAMIAHAVP
jgi:hypothetical protein